jgi:hypothetical protein
VIDPEAVQLNHLCHGVEVFDAEADSPCAERAQAGGDPQLTGVLDLQVIFGSEARIRSA